MIEKFGFVLSHLAPAQLPYKLIKSANEFLEKKDSCDIIIFYQNLSPLVVNPNFAIMNLSEAYNYDGRLVATEVNNAARILDYVGTRKKYFYVWDLEWTKMGNKVYEQLSSVYNNPRINLIARSKQHYDIIKLAWREPVGIVDDCNFEKMTDLILEFEKK